MPQFLTHVSFFWKNPSAHVTHLFTLSRHVLHVKLHCWHVFPFAKKPSGHLALHVRTPGPVHRRTVSSLCWQLDWPQGRWRQSSKDFSLPTQKMSSNHILPVPLGMWPKEAVVSAFPRCSSLQTTFVSAKSHPSSHTVPHTPSWYTSNRPSR